MAWRTFQIYVTASRRVHVQCILYCLPSIYSCCWAQSGSGRQRQKATMFVCISRETFARSSLKGILMTSPAPLRSSIIYEKRPFRLAPTYNDDGTLSPNRTSDFNGPPRADLDEAWSRLLKCEYHTNESIYLCKFWCWSHQTKMSGFTKTSLGSSPMVKSL